MTAERNAIGVSYDMHYLPLVGGSTHVIREIPNARGVSHICIREIREITSRWSVGLRRVSCSKKKETHYAKKRSACERSVLSAAPKARSVGAPSPRTASVQICEICGKTKTSCVFLAPTAHKGSRRYHGFTQILRTFSKCAEPREKTG